MNPIGRFIVSQAASYVFAATAVTLTALHPAIHHIENGTLDSILDYLYVTSLNAMSSKDYS